MTAPKGRGETVLVVDGDPVLRELVSEMLSFLGYRVLKAADERSALAILEARNDVDLLFTTVVLPSSMTGVELAEKARSRVPHLKVLYTSDDPDEVAGQMASLGEDAEFIARPWRRGDLARKVRAVLDAPTA
ncbi:MAG: response regulator [Rhodospirillales bacterium]